MQKQALIVIVFAFCIEPFAFRPMGLSAVYLASTIRTFALSLLGIFTPLYIYQILGNTQIFISRADILLGIVGYYIVLR